MPKQALRPSPLRRPSRARKSPRSTMARRAQTICSQRWPDDWRKRPALSSSAFIASRRPQHPARPLFSKRSSPRPTSFSLEPQIEGAVRRGVSTTRRRSKPAEFRPSRSRARPSKRSPIRWRGSCACRMHGLSSWVIPSVGRPPKCSISGRTLRSKGSSESSRLRLVSGELGLTQESPWACGLPLS